MTGRTLSVWLAIAAAALPLGCGSDSDSQPGERQAGDVEATTLDSAADARQSDITDVPPEVAEKLETKDVDVSVVVVPVELDFNELQTDLRDRGYPTVIAELRSDPDHTGNLRLAAALDRARAITEEDPDQLWFQLQAHTRLKGWEDLQTQLHEQRPDDTLSALTSALEPVCSAVVKTWKLADATVTHIAHSSDLSRVYMGANALSLMGADRRAVLTVLDANTLNTVHQLDGLQSVMTSVRGPEGDLLIGYNYGTKRAVAYHVDTGKEAADLGPHRLATWYLGDCPPPPGIATTSDGTEIFRDENRFNIRRMSFTDPTASTQFAKPEAASMNRAMLMALDEKEENLLVADSDGFLWNFSCADGTATGEPVRVIPGSVTSHALNSDGTRLVSSTVRGSRDGKSRTGAIVCWNVKTNNRLFEHVVEEPILATAFLGDGETVVAGGLNGSVLVFPPPVGGSAETYENAKGTFVTPSKAFRAHTFAITRLLPTKDGTRVFSGNRKGCVKLIDLSAHAAEPTPLPEATAVVRRAVSLDDRWEADFSLDKVNIRDCQSGQLLHEIKIGGGVTQSLGDLKSVALDPDGPSAVLGGTKGLLHWNLESGESRPVAIDSTWSAEDGSHKGKGPPPKLPVIVSPNGKHAVVFSRQSVAVYDAESGERRSVVTPGVRHFAEPYAFLPDDRFAIKYQGFVDKVRVDGVRVFDLGSGKEVANLLHGAEMVGVAFARKTGTIVTLGRLEHGGSSEGRKFAVWTPGSEMPEYIDAPTSVDRVIGMTDDGERLLAVNIWGDSQSVVTVFDWTTRKVIRRFALETDIGSEPQFDGRTLTVVTAHTKERHRFQYHRAGQGTVAGPAHDRRQDTGLQDTGRQDTGRQDTGRQDTGLQDTGETSATPAVAEFRMWQDATGQFSVEAKYLSQDGDNVVLQHKADNREIKVPLDLLSPSDQRFVAQQQDASDNQLD